MCRVEPYIAVYFTFTKEEVEIRRKMAKPYTTLHTTLHFTPDRKKRLNFYNKCTGVGLITYRANIFSMVSFTASLNHEAYKFISKKADQKGVSVNRILQEIVEHEMTKGENK